jgi:hypothetical protein
MNEEWNNDDEYMEYDEVPESAVAAVAESSDFPAEVMVRIKAYAERTGKSTADVRKEFLSYIESEYDCSDWTAEDDDLLVDWAEQMFVQTRRQASGSNANTATWCGVFVGKDGKMADRMANLVRWNLRNYDDDPEGAIGSGRLGLYSKEGDGWLFTTVENSKSFGQSEAPPHGIRHKDEWLALASRSGDPTPHVKMGQYAYFLGNEEGEFTKNATATLWRVDLTGDNANMTLDIGRPCRITVRPPKDGGNEAFKDVLTTYDDFAPDYKFELPVSSMVYLTNDSIHDLFVPIEDLEQAYEERKQSGNINGETRSWGPLIITKGTVSRMSSESRASDYDPAGYNYNLTVSSTIHGDIDCWIPGHVGDQTSPFTAGWGEDRFDYAERSTVLVFGRIGMKERDGLVTPKMNVMGVYADPRRCRRRATGGDTGLDQFA